MMSFDWWGAFFLLPLPILVRIWMKPLPRLETALAVPLLERYQLGTAPLDRSNSRLAGIGMWIFWLALILAASRPIWLGADRARTVSGRDLLIAVDISGSMSETDMAIDGKTSSRLDVVKLVLKKFIDGRQGDRMGLILFGTNAYSFVPLTYDLAALQEMLLDISTGLAGRHTAIGDAIGLAIKVMREPLIQHKVLVLITDGSNTAGFENPTLAAMVARQRGITIHTIGVGSSLETLSDKYGRQNIPVGLLLNQDLLRQIAELTGGRYFHASKRDTLDQIYQTLDLLEPVVHENQSHRPRHELFVWPLALAMILLMIMVSRRIWMPARGVIQHE